MPYFENSKEFRISGGRVTNLKRIKSDYSRDPSSKVSEIDNLSRSDSSTGRMIVIGQGAATRVVVTPTTSASRSSSRAPSRAASPKRRREPSFNTQSLGQPPPQPPKPKSRIPSSSSNIPQQTGPWVPSLPDKTLARSSQSQGAPGSTDMVGFTLPGTSSPPTFPVPSPSMPFDPVTTAATQPNSSSMSSPEIQRQPNPVSAPVFGPAEFPGPSSKPGNKISRSGTSSSDGKEEDKTKKKVMKRFFEMWSRR